MMGARAASLLSDGMVLVLTAVKTFWIKKHTSISRGTMITDIMLRDTLLYFALLCVVNVIGLVTGHLTTDIAGVLCTCEFIEVWQLWSCILNSVLLSRLTLDLRGAAPGLDSSMTTATRSGSVRPDGDTQESEAIELDTEVSAMWMGSRSATGVGGLETADAPQNAGSP
ncbi:uncharacterized protein B0H18DRAFT_121762 [Fomitopsis serialis]|uniref:uncharacterized protein n=1 Tax=Fomitopsis serialis TaxID=139415 RepID=UPI0020080544|nr:uncharacterized protein B0H18DRAFT_121762 [Neoantrodia serialis]KAH9914798.1 hypothetical protein B0H18DRAFT_121762 [Neoantrodia serialis]